MAVDQLSDWLRANHVGLLIGALIAGAIVAGLLLVKWLGERARERDPEHTTWRAIIGGACAKTSLIFIIVAAADAFATYADLPPRLDRLIDIQK